MNDGVHVQPSDLIPDSPSTTPAESIHAHLHDHLPVSASSKESSNLSPSSPSHQSTSSTTARASAPGLDHSSHQHLLQPTASPPNSAQAAHPLPLDRPSLPTSSTNSTSLRTSISDRSQLYRSQASTPSPTHPHLPFHRISKHRQMSPQPTPQPTSRGPTAPFQMKTRSRVARSSNPPTFAQTTSSASSSSSSSSDNLTFTTPDHHLSTQSAQAISDPMPPAETPTSTSSPHMAPELYDFSSAGLMPGLDAFSKSRSPSIASTDPSFQSPNPTQPSTEKRTLRPRKSLASAERHSFSNGQKRSTARVSSHTPSTPDSHESHQTPTSDLRRKSPRPASHSISSVDDSPRHTAPGASDAMNLYSTSFDSPTPVENDTIPVVRLRMPSFAQPSPDKRKLRPRNINDPSDHAFGSNAKKRKASDISPDEPNPKRQLLVTLKYAHKADPNADTSILQDVPIDSSFEGKLSTPSSVNGHLTPSTFLEPKDKNKVAKPRMQAIDAESVSPSESHSPRKPTRGGAAGRLRGAKNFGFRRGRQMAKGYGGGRDSPDPPFRRGPMTQNDRVEISMLKARQHELKKFFNTVGNQQCDILDLLATKDITKICRKPRAHKHVPQYDQVVGQLQDILEQTEQDVRARYELELEYELNRQREELEAINQQYQQVVVEIRKEFIAGSEGDIMLFEHGYRAAHDDTYTESGSSVDIFPHYHECPEPNAKIRGYVSSHIVDEKPFKGSVPTDDDAKARQQLLNEDIILPLLREMEYRDQRWREDYASRSGQTMDALALEAERELEDIERSIPMQRTSTTQNSVYALSTLADVSEQVALGEIATMPFNNPFRHNEPAYFRQERDYSPQPESPAALPQPYATSSFPPLGHPELFQPHPYGQRPTIYSLYGISPVFAPSNGVMPPAPAIVPKQSQPSPAPTSFRPVSRNAISDPYDHLNRTAFSSSPVNRLVPARPRSSTTSATIPPLLSPMMSSGPGQAIAPAPPKANTRSSLSGLNTFRTRLSSLNSNSSANASVGSSSLSNGPPRFIFTTPQQAPQHQSAPSPTTNNPSGGPDPPSSSGPGPAATTTTSSSSSESRARMPMMFVNQTIESRKAAAAALSSSSRSGSPPISGGSGSGNGSGNGNGTPNIKGGQRILLPKM